MVIFTQQTQAPANRNARLKQWQPWLAACQRKHACVSCGFRLRNERNASDCVWMETGLDCQPIHRCACVHSLHWGYYSFRLKYSDVCNVPCHTWRTHFVAIITLGTSWNGWAWISAISRNGLDFYNYANWQSEKVISWNDWNIQSLREVANFTHWL